MGYGMRQTNPRRGGEEFQSELVSDFGRGWMQGMMDAAKQNRKNTSCLSKTRSIIQRWASKQGHDLCHYHPDILAEIAKVVGVNIPKAKLPPRAEFEAGCARYQNRMYGKKKSVSPERH